MSLDLDERQRAMLEEMHVRVWWPMEPVADARAMPAAPPAAAVAAPSSARAAPSAVPIPQVPASVAASAAVTGAAVTSTAAQLGTMDWHALAGAVAACTACKLCTGRKAAVFQQEATARQVDWLVVGEPPDEQEERSGAPFAGQAGQLLDNMLRALQLTRDGAGSAGARLTNVVKCRPAAVRNPQPDELASCAAYLRREVALAQPRVILAMGRFAALSLLAENHPELAALPFGKLRGQIYRYQGVPVVVTHHPSRLLRAQEDKAGAWADLCLAAGVARGDTRATGS